MKYSVVNGNYLDYLKINGKSLNNSLPVRRIQEDKADYYIVKENDNFLKDYIVYNVDDNYIMTMSINDLKNIKMIKELLQKFKDKYENITIKLLKGSRCPDSEGFAFVSLNHDYYGMKIHFKIERC